MYTTAQQMCISETKTRVKSLRLVRLKTRPRGFHGGHRGSTSTGCGVDSIDKLVLWSLLSSLASLSSVFLLPLPFVFAKSTSLDCNLSINFN